jgi:hypothetical protein
MLSLSAIDISGQKITIMDMELNNTTNQMGHIDIPRMPHPITAKYTFFPRAHGTLN